MVRELLAIGVLICPAAGCAGKDAAGGGAGDSGPDCVAHLEWNGGTYESAGDPEKPLALEEPLGKGIIPGCEAPFGENDIPDQQVTVVRIRGVSPSVAVSVEGEGDPPYAWLAPGYLPESPRHPLHDSIYGGSRQPNAEAGFRCDAPRTMTARALTTPAFDFVYLRVKAEDESLEQFLVRDGVDRIVTLDANTVITGFERDGIPFIRAGDEFTLVLRECEGTEAEPGLAGLRRLVVKELHP